MNYWDRLFPTIGGIMKTRRIGVLGVCTIVLFAVFLLSLIPIGLVAQYDRMYCDDYDYSALTHNAVIRDGSISGVFSAAVQTVRQIYENWQGTFSAVFLFSLQPAIVDQGWYALTPLILIGTLILGLSFFCRAVCTDLLQMNRRAWLLVWALASILCVQFPRDATEGFFWYNSGMFYTFFFGLLLLWVGLAIGLMKREHLGEAKRILTSVILVLLSVLLAGGNYPTALLALVTIGYFVLWSALKNRRVLPTMAITFIVFGLGFYGSIVAPGNSVRQSLLERSSAFSAIFSATTETPVRVLGQLLRHPGIMAIIALIWVPLCVVLLKSSKQRFRLPLLVPIASWLVIAVMFTPTQYAMGNAGPYRLWNIILFTFYLLLMFNVFYLLGWWKRRHEAHYEKAEAFLQKQKRFAPIYLTVVLSLSILLSGVGPSLGIERESATSVRAAQSLADGYNRTYAEAFDRQAEAIEQSPVGSVVIQAIPDPDALIPDGDLTLYIPKSYEPSQWFDRDLQMPDSN